MKSDQVDEVIAAMRQRVSDWGPLPAETLDAIQIQIAYWENIRERMKYGTFRQQGYFCGSGVIEAGCRAVIGKRLKQSGMFWT